MSTIDVWVLPAAAAHAGLARLLGGAVIERRADGKPWVAGGPHFNLSHSGELALIALCADMPVGVDLERIRPLRNPAGLARRMCSERELEYLAGRGDLGGHGDAGGRGDFGGHGDAGGRGDFGGHGDAAGRGDFGGHGDIAGRGGVAAELFRLWVRKEAVAKAEGGGLATALSGIDVLGPRVSARGARWWVHDLVAPADGYVGAVAWADGP